MWLLIVRLSALIMSVAVGLNYIWVWRFLFWIEMRLPKRVEEL